MSPMSAEPKRAGKKSSDSPENAPGPAVVTLPKAWLIALAAFLIVPWLIVGAIYFQQSTETAASRPAESSSVPRVSAPGPWGQLAVTPLVISPPMEYIAGDWSRGNEPDQWFFPGTPVDVMEAFLASTGLSADQVRRLKASARPHPGIKGQVIAPEAELVRGLSPEVRARLYLELGKTQLNFDQANAFRFHSASIEDWLGKSSVSPATRQVVDPLVYRDGQFLLFADTEVVRALVGDEQELRRLAKALLRQSTMVVQLTVKDHREIDALAEYWGRGGRRTDLRPFLESVYESVPGRSVDIIHLLPTFARSYLYRYPRITAADLNRPLLANCLWSSLNFFSAQPDDRFLDLNTALGTLQRDYYIVEDNFQLGDIVAFVDANGNLFHVASYLADDMVYSKNGTSPLAPWAITTLEQLKGLYRLRSANPRLIVHRRHDM